MATERLLLLAPADLSSCSKRFILYTPAFMGPLDADPNDVGLGSRRRLRSQSVAACLRCPCGAGAAPKVASCAWPQSRWASGHQFLFRRGPRSCGLADAERPGTPPPRSSAAIVAANRGPMHIWRKHPRSSLSSPANGSVAQNSQAYTVDKVSSPIKDATVTPT